MSTESTDVESDDAVESIYSGVPPLDVDKYRKFVEDMDISDEECVELLRILWSIMATFVDLGFGVESVQRCLPALAEFSLAASPSEVKEVDGKFNEAAAKRKDKDDG